MNRLERQEKLAKITKETLNKKKENRDMKRILIERLAKNTDYDTRTVVEYPSGFTMEEAVDHATRYQSQGGLGWTMVKVMEIDTEDPSNCKYYYMDYEGKYCYMDPRKEIGPNEVPFTQYDNQDRQAYNLPKDEAERYMNLVEGPTVNVEKPTSSGISASELRKYRKHLKRSKPKNIVRCDNIFDLGSSIHAVINGENWDQKILFDDWAVVFKEHEEIPHIQAYIEQGGHKIRTTHSAYTGDDTINYIINSITESKGWLTEE